MNCQLKVSGQCAFLLDVDLVAPDLCSTPEYWHTVSDIQWSSQKYKCVFDGFIGMSTRHELVEND